MRYNHVVVNRQSGALRVRMQSRAMITEFNPKVNVIGQCSPSVCLLEPYVKCWFLKQIIRLILVRVTNKIYF